MRASDILNEKGALNVRASIRKPANARPIVSSNEFFIFQPLLSGRMTIQFKCDYYNSFLIIRRRPLSAVGWPAGPT